MQLRWREQLVASGHAPRATAAARMEKTAVYGGIDQLVSTGVLVPLTAFKRNRAWEAVGLLELVEGLEAGELD